MKTSKSEAELTAGGLAQAMRAAVVARILIAPYRKVPSTKSPMSGWRWRRLCAGLSVLHHGHASALGLTM